VIGLVQHLQMRDVPPNPALTVSLGLSFNNTADLDGTVVDNNPSAFEDAYWVVNSFNVYTPMLYT
jgi:hypothetical protein